MDCKSCDICEFNMGVCAGRSDIYGKPIDEVKKSYPDNFLKAYLKDYCAHLQQFQELYRDRVYKNHGKYAEELRNQS